LASHATAKGTKAESRRGRGEKSEEAVVRGHERRKAAGPSTPKAKDSGRDCTPKVKIAREAASEARNEHKEKEKARTKGRGEAEAEGSNPTMEASWTRTEILGERETSCSSERRNDSSCGLKAADLAAQAIAGGEPKEPTVRGVLSTQRDENLTIGISTG
jgi:hypothetical protein